MGMHQGSARSANIAGMDRHLTLAGRAGRVVALLLVLLTFLRAGTAAPCDAHREGGGHQHHPGQAAQAAGTHAHHDHAPADGQRDAHGECHCLGACHPAATPALPGAPCGLAAVTIALAPVTNVPGDVPAVARANQAYVLPYATAPPLRAA